MSFDFRIVMFTLRSRNRGLTENEGEPLGLLERLRAEFKDLWGTSSKLHFRLSRRYCASLPIPTSVTSRRTCPFAWRCGIGTTIHIRWVVSTSSSAPA
jgi:hypothetical protein